MKSLAIKSALLYYKWNRLNLLKPKLGLCVAGYIACKLVICLISVNFRVTESKKYVFFIIIEEGFFPGLMSVGIVLLNRLFTGNQLIHY